LYPQKKYTIKGVTVAPKRAATFHVFFAGTGISAEKQNNYGSDKEWSEVIKTSR
jgi:hypothetical protein